MKKNLLEAQKRMLLILKEIRRICDENDIEYFLIDGTLLGAKRHKGFIPWDDDIDIGMLRSDYEKFIEVCKHKLSEDYFLQQVETDKEYDLYHIPLKIRDNNSKIIEENGKKYHQGLYVDVFPFDNIPNGNMKFKFQKIISNVATMSILNIEDKAGMKNKIYKIVGRINNYEKVNKLRKILMKLNEKDSNEISYGIEMIWKNKFKKSDIFPLEEIEFCGEKFKAPKNVEKILENLYGDYMTLPKEEERIWHAKEIYIYK